MDNISVPRCLKLRHVLTPGIEENERHRFFVLGSRYRRGLGLLMFNVVVFAQVMRAIAYL